MTRSWLRLSLVMAGLFIVAACSSATPYNGAFRDMNGASGNGKLVSFPENEAFNASKEALVSHGFIIDASQTSLENGLILANRKMQDASDSEVSYEITATVNLLPKDTNATFVALSANEKKIRYQKERIWWHLLWLIPIFPVGTEYHTVERPENTVTDESFYNDFFTSLDQTLHAIAQPGKNKVPGAVR